MKDRNKNRAALVIDMERVLTTQTTEFWLEKFATLGIPHAPINTYDQVFSHPQVKHRGLRIDLARARAHGGGNVAMVASPVRMSETPVEYRYAPPANGADANAVLRDMLEMGDAEIDALRAAKVL
jgi:crotonobetainyl-CoA:carnitine CoA-transferase CaiB-like acyl-CoA transferase